LDITTRFQIGILIILLILSAFFSATETALMSLSKLRVRHMINENVEGSELVMKLLQNPGKLLGAILIGNNIINIGASALATAIFIRYFGGSGVGIATVVMTVLLLIFGEITPKSLAAANAERVSLRVARPLSVIATILNPLIIIITKLTDVIIRILGGKKNEDGPSITEEELKTIVDVSHEEGVLEQGEREFIHNIFEFTDLQVREVMTQRIDIAAVEAGLTFQEVKDIFIEEQFSRLLVYEGSLDNPIGILHVKDLISYCGEDGDFDVRQYMRKIYFTYEYKPITKLFTEMRKNRVSIAVVLDEYGGTAGLVTVEDLVEEVVGDIVDEYDEHSNDIVKLNVGEYTVEGATDIDTVNETLNIDLQSQDYQTISGFITGELGHIPEKGEVVEYENVKFIVESIQRNRIAKVKILLK
jgi:putative hemolysin